MVAFVTPSASYPELFRDLQIDTQAFMPYFRIVMNPMNSKLTRFWSNSVGNSLNGREIMMQLQAASSDILTQEFNPHARDTLD
jgi:hypothetical protein